LERGANDLHMVQLMPLPSHDLLLHQNSEWFTFLVPAYPGCAGKAAVKRVLLRDDDDDCDADQLRLRTRNRVDSYLRRRT